MLSWQVCKVNLYSIQSRKSKGKTGIQSEFQQKAEFSEQNKSVHFDPNDFRSGILNFNNKPEQIIRILKNLEKINQNT